MASLGDVRVEVHKSMPNASNYATWYDVLEIRIAMVLLAIDSGREVDLDHLKSVLLGRQ